ncbi:class II histone deacetylase [Streptomyces sp. NPDC001508]|uniref:class II histone deacetylase n=1 Tax=Streptomyces sp. NPDC001508 TaxID=3154656 RepID=UPI00331802FE
MDSEKSGAARRVGFVSHEQYYWHQSIVAVGGDIEPGAELETPTPRRRLLNLLTKSGLLSLTHPLQPLMLEREDLLRAHGADYIDAFERLSAAAGGELGDFAGFGPGSFDIAVLSAGGAAEAVRAVTAGEVDTAYALVRPPGHHAERDRARGYCLLANLPIAILKARADQGLGRVAVVDWDVHHGNGTQSIFYDDPDVLAVSLHQERLYPHDSGMITETGTGDAVGTTVNLPLPAGSGLGAYEYAFAKVVEPALRAFRPDLIAVACGFDAGGLDPNGRMALPAKAFGTLTGRLLQLADELCDGRLVLAQEGGYSALHVPFCGAQTLSALLGVSDLVTDPFAEMENSPEQPLAVHQKAAVDAARQAACDSGAVTEGRS